MLRTMIVFRRDIKEYTSWKFYKLVPVAYFAVAAIVILKLMSGMEGQLESTLSSAAYVISFIPLIACIPLFATGSLTREKSNGTITSLLATPIKPVQLVMGKSFAVFFTGFALSVFGSIVFLFCAAIMSFNMTGIVFMPISLLMILFLLNPVLCLGMTVFSMQLSMIKSPEVAVSPSYVFGLLFIIGVPICTGAGIFTLTDWVFPLGILIISLCLWLLVIIFMLTLKKERILLSQ